MRSATWMVLPVFILIVAIDMGVCLAQSTHGQDLRHGQTIYRIYCAVCHGDDGHGDGPMSTILKVKVPDLTQIKMRNGGVFPVEGVQRKIDGSESDGLGHGTREMPIFGPVFTQVGPNGKNGRARVNDLTKYLQSIQMETSGKKTSLSFIGPTAWFTRLAARFFFLSRCDNGTPVRAEVAKRRLFRELRSRSNPTSISQLEAVSGD